MEETTPKKIAAIQAAIREKVSELKRKRQDLEEHYKEKYKPIIRTLEARVVSDSTNSGLKFSDTHEDYSPRKKILRPSSLPIPASLSATPPNLTKTLKEEERCSSEHLSPVKPGLSSRRSLIPVPTTSSRTSTPTSGCNKPSCSVTPREFSNIPVFSSCEVFESPKTPIEKVCDEASTPEGKKLVEKFLEEVGNVSSEYIRKFTENKTRDFDDIYGIRFDGEHFFIGDSIVSIKDDWLEVEGNSYRITSGLAELLFKKQPVNKIMQNDDLVNYKEILELTNAHKKRYSASEAINVQMTSSKYKTIISKLFERRKSKSGRGPISNPNSLVDKLKYLLENFRAGNEKEICEIEGNLRRGGIIA